MASDSNGQSVARYDVLPPEWKTNNVGLQAFRMMETTISRVGNQGIYAGIPIICRGQQCPFLETCAMETLHIDVNTLVGQRCPIEIAEIMHLYDRYTKQFDIEPNSEDMVQMGLIKELIDYEIQIRRADHRMSAQGDFLEDVVVGVSDNGHPIVNKEIAKPIDYKERALKKKHEILQLLNSTPKDKAGAKDAIVMDPSTYAATLMQKAREFAGKEIIDAEIVEESKEK